MPTPRRTVDLSDYPDLVVIVLGMRVNAVTGLRTLFGFGPTNQAGDLSDGEASEPAVSEAELA